MTTPSPDLPDPSDVPDPLDRSSRSSILPYIPATIVVPLATASLGIDGGPIFQILAIDNLGLSATAIGFAFGLGVVSLPIQIYASRIPIERALRNMQIFLALAALQVWVLAVLVGVGATGEVASLALGVTVTAEISVSVLFATAWQPLLASGVDTHTRQRLNSTWPAIARGVLAGAVFLFAALDSTGRTIFLTVVGVLAIAAAGALGVIDAPKPPSQHEAPSMSSGSARSDSRAGKATSLAPATRVGLVVFAVVNVGAIPLWLVYLAKVLWPTANLGAIGAVQIVASMLALLAWKPTDGDVTRRALVAAVATLIGAVSVAAFVGPVESTMQQAIVVGATAVMAAGVTTTRVAMVEATHRVVTPANTVRAFTLLDVVASTSLQVGLLFSGLLIAASTSTGFPAWLADPYRAFVVVTTVLAIPAIVWFKRISARDRVPVGPGGS